MKLKKLLILCLISAIFCQNIFAKTISSSPSSNGKYEVYTWWYDLSCKDDREQLEEDLRRLRDSYSYLTWDLHFLSESECIISYVYLDDIKRGSNE